MTLAAANTYSGATTISGGQILLTNPLAMQNSAYDTTGSNGTTIGLDFTNGLNSGNLTLGGLSGAVDLAGAITGGYAGVSNLTLNNGTGASNTYSGSIADGATGMTLTKTGAGTQILTGTNTYTGATIISAGILIVNGNITTSNVTITGGTLGGSGTFGGTISMGAGSTLSPGNSPGTMTFTNAVSLSGSTLMEIDGNAGAGVAGGHDFVNLTGSGAAGELTYGGTMTLDIGTVFAAGGYIWDLFDFASETGTFAGITLADSYSGSLTDGGSGVWSLISGNNTWQFTESDGVLTLNVIPEPSTALLGAIGMLLLLRRRR